MEKIDTSRMPNDEKFRELVVFICQRSLGDRRFGATKLNKLLFYADFLAYVKFGRAITWHSYQKLKNGPAPRALMPILDDMKQRGDVAQSEHDYYGRRQIRTIALRDADLTAFSSAEIALVTELIDEFWDRNAREMSLMSHQFKGWRSAEVGETIPYESALVNLIKEPSDLPDAAPAKVVSELGGYAKDYFTSHGAC